jgi:FAD synthetase
MATGTFDLLHPGHLLYLERSRALGDELVVVVARDANVKYKPRPVVPEDQRLAMVAALKIVDLAVLGDEKDFLVPVMRLCPDIITLGYDQHFDPDALRAQMKCRGQNPAIIRIDAHDGCELCKSSRIVDKILKSQRDSRTEEGPG